ncbi:MAG: N-acetyltransferase [Pseudomonadota bacterium]
MSIQNFSIRPERASDAAAIAHITATVFGPGMFTRAAYVLREGVDHDPRLSFVATPSDAETPVASVRLTSILWGDRKALMLGPLCVLPKVKHQGLGKALMQQAVLEAQRLAEADECPPIIMLVGDLPYYAPFGFKTVAPGKISLPRPADPARILACELLPQAASGFEGACRSLKS